MVEGGLGVGRAHPKLGVQRGLDLGDARSSLATQNALRQIREEGRGEGAHTSPRSSDPELLQSSS